MYITIRLNNKKSYSIREDKVRQKGKRFKTIKFCKKRKSKYLEYKSTETSDNRDMCVPESFGVSNGKPEDYKNKKGGNSLFGNGKPYLYRHFLNDPIYS